MTLVVWGVEYRSVQEGLEIADERQWLLQSTQYSKVLLFVMCWDLHLRLENCLPETGTKLSSHITIHCCIQESNAANLYFRTRSFHHRHIGLENFVRKVPLCIHQLQVSGDRDVSIKPSSSLERVCVRETSLWYLSQNYATISHIGLPIFAESGKKAYL